MEEQGSNGAGELAYDIDVMRPPPVRIKVLDEVIDIGFIPAGVAMHVQQLQDNMTELRRGRSAKELADDPTFRVENFKIMVDVVERVIEGRTALTRKRLEAELSLQQLERLISLVFTHMYGPETAAKTQERVKRLEAELDEATEAAEQDEPKKGGPRRQTGQTPSPSAAGSTSGQPTTASTT